MKRFVSSFFVHVALGLAVFMAAGLWFVATHFTPQATYTAENGKAYHVFWQTAFLTKILLAYALLLGPVYGIARVVRWLTTPPSSE